MRQAPEAPALRETRAAEVEGPIDGDLPGSKELTVRYVRESSAMEFCYYCIHCDLPLVYLIVGIDGMALLESELNLMRAPSMPQDAKAALLHMQRWHGAADEGTMWLPTDTQASQLGLYLLAATLEDGSCVSAAWPQVSFDFRCEAHGTVRSIGLRTSADDASSADRVRYPILAHTLCSGESSGCNGAQIREAFMGAYQRLSEWHDPDAPGADSWGALPTTPEDIAALCARLTSPVDMGGGFGSMRRRVERALHMARPHGSAASMIVAEAARSLTDCPSAEQFVNVPGRAPSKIRYLMNFTVLTREFWVDMGDAAGVHPAFVLHDERPEITARAGGSRAFLHATRRRLRSRTFAWALLQRMSSVVLGIVAMTSTSEERCGLRHGDAEVAMEWLGGRLLMQLERSGRAVDRIVVELPPLPGQEAGVATCGSVRDRAVLAWRALARAHGLCRNLLAVALLALDRRRMKALLLPGGEGGDDGLAGEELQERLSNATSVLDLCVSFGVAVRELHQWPLDLARHRAHAAAALLQVSPTGGGPMS